MKTVLVTGGSGQLATAIRQKTVDLSAYKIIYADSKMLDITDVEALKEFFNRTKIDFCVNCAAYTAVDKAESEQKLAEKINVKGAKNLAEFCDTYNISLIHISTDFVFGGEKSSIYTEDDATNPLNVYGKTKLEGEKEIVSTLRNHFIIRTSWLYSEHGHNFLKTMLKLGKEREELSVVCDQIGTPTFAGDLAGLIKKIIIADSTSYGIYHYSNEGVASWYDFAKAIFYESGLNLKVNPITTQQYPTPAQRPLFSVMDKRKVKEEFDIDIPYWNDSLRYCIEKVGF